MATNPNFTSTPRATVSRLTTPDTSRDGATITGSTISFSAGTNGSRLDFITFVSSVAIGVASTNKVCRVFLTDTSGLNPRLISETTFTSVTPSATAIGQTVTITYTNGLVIGSGQLIRTTMSTGTDTIDVIARGGDF